MKKLWNWLRTSHRLEHIVLSVVIGLLFNNLIYTAICATLVGLTLTIVPALIINGIKTLVLLWIG